MTVRVTMHPGEDVELSDGVPPAHFREPLAELLRRPELRRADLLADGTPVPEECRAGERPLLPGTVLTVGQQHGHRSADRGDDDATLRTRWMLTRTTGAAAGRLVPVGGPADLLRAVRDLTRPAGPDAARHRRGGRRHRPRLRLRRGGANRILSPPPPAPDPAWLVGLVPVLAPIGLAALLRQPTLALFALLGLAALLPHALRRRHAPGPSGRSRPHRAGPDALLAYATAAQHAAPGTWRAARAAWTRAGTHPGWPGGAWDDLLADGAVAVVGPAETARSVARAIVADLAVQGRPVQVLGTTRHWTWCRWITTPGPVWSGPGHDPDTPGPEDTAQDATPPRATTARTTRAPVLVVDHGTRHDHTAARRATARGALAVVLGTTTGCRTVVTVRAGRLHVTGPGTRRRTRPLVGVTAAWADHLARRLAGARHLGRTPDTLRGHRTPTDIAHLPDDVPLGSLHDLDAATTGSTGPRSGRWAVPLGRTTTGTITWDLVADGPHLLVAGTTGSGKSELLRSLVLGLALQHPPAHLMLGLVDFKGGAGLGGLTGLPHVVGQVTDLDAALAARALAGLQAELRHRKATLAEHGVADISALAPGTVPRLVVVVDEFRALVDDLPDLLPGLVRIAAQGRSLGVHLVLATQRPAGAVNADMRANVTARLALRVTDPLESRDVVDCPDAAALPVDRPGRAILRVGSGAPVPLQCAHTGPGRQATFVRRAPTFGRPGGSPRRGRAGDTAAVGEPGPRRRHGRHRTHDVGGAGAPEAPAEGPAPDGTAELVAAIRREHGGSSPHPPLWLPPLPDLVAPADLTDGDEPAAGLPLALGDLPEQRRRRVVRWDPAEGNLAVLGHARSGRTTVLTALAVAARAQGMSVLTLTPTATEMPAAKPDLLLVDDLDALRTARPGWAPPAGIPLALSARNPSVAHAYGVGPRLVLLSRDRADDVALGAPVSLAGSGGVPGRAAWSGRAGALLCQTLHSPAVPSTEVVT